MGVKRIFTGMGDYSAKRKKRERAVETLVLANMGVEQDPETVAAAQMTVLEAAGPELPETPKTGEWKPGETVVKDETERTFAETTYLCRQSHVTQADWTPDITPALWKEKEVDPVEGGESTPPRWVDLPDNHPFAVGNYFMDYGKTYEVLRAFFRQDHMRPPALIDDYYKQV